MNIYLETGFVITLSLKQDLYQPAERLLDYANMNAVVLTIPMFCLNEAITAINGRVNARNRLIQELKREARELGRTEPNRNLSSELESVIVRLQRATEDGQPMLETTALDIARLCNILPSDAFSVGRARSLRLPLELSFQDALILSTILLDLEQNPSDTESLFISQNTRDFGSPAIRALLRSRNCRYLSNFSDAVRIIERANP